MCHMPFHNHSSHTCTSVQFLHTFAVDASVGAFQEWAQTNKRSKGDARSAEDSKYMLGCIARIAAGSKERTPKGDLPRWQHVRTTCGVRCKALVHSPADTLASDSAGSCHDAAVVRRVSSYGADKSGSTAQLMDLQGYLGQNTRRWSLDDCCLVVHQEKILTDLEVEPCSLRRLVEHSKGIAGVAKSRLDTLHFEDRLGSLEMYLNVLKTGSRCNQTLVWRSGCT